MDFPRIIQVPRSADGAPPSSWGPLVGLVAGAAALLAISFAAGLAGPDLLTAPIALAIFGLLVTARRSLEARRRRADADELIALGFERRLSRHAWRVQELTGSRERRLLARSVRGLVSDLAPGRLLGASPINRPALRPHRALLLELAERLSAVDRPVTASGILAVHRLLTSPDGPLYSPEPTMDRARHIVTTTESLEVR